MKILVMGATGYVGGRLVPRLATAGHEVRCLTRRPEKLGGVPWAGSVEIVAGDALDRASLELPAGLNRRFDIAGPDVVSYREMMPRYAAVAGLTRRVIIPVPVLSPWLSSQWVNVVTPVPKAIAQPLIGSLRNNAVAHEHDIETFIPFVLCPLDEALRLALESVRRAQVTTRWSGAQWPGAPSDPMPTDPDWSGGTTYRDDRSTPIDGDAADVWRAVEGIGGERGWYSFPLAWALRGFLDRLAGGVGLRRGRRDPDRLEVGDAVDFWRVEAVERPTLLRLRAEMKLPGDAWLEFTITHEQGRPVLHQRALFIPHGLLGQLCWWGISPFHNTVFGSMIANLARRAAAAKV